MASFTDVRTIDPKSTEQSDQAQATLNLVVPKPFEHQSQICLLGFQIVEPLNLLGTVHLGVSGLDKLQEVPGVCVPGNRHLAARLQTLPRELPHRLQHPEPRLAPRPLRS